MTAPLTIWIVDPYHAGSHAQWSLGAKRCWEESGHDVTLHTMPGRHWKWRMHGAAAWFAALMHHDSPPDVLVTTDMCDVAQLRGLMPRHWQHVQVATYFHENQLTFPWSPGDNDPQSGRDLSYGYINVSSCLASDAVWFNSEHHRTAFLEAASSFLHSMPKPRLHGWLDEVRRKTSVLPLGLNLASKQPKAMKDPPDVPVVVWNQRWSWDKGADRFVAFVQALIAEELDARFVVLGQPFQRQPDGWLDMKEAMGNRCLHWGFAESESEYWQWLSKGTVAPVDPRQEYFGIAVVEAMRCGVIPWVPEQHAYTETMPPRHPYLNHERWTEAMRNRRWATWPVAPSVYADHALRYDWTSLSGRYNEALDALVNPQSTPPRQGL